MSVQTVRMAEGTSAIIFYLKRMRCHFFQFFPEVHSSRFLHHLSGIHSGGRKKGREVKGAKEEQEGRTRRESGIWSDIGNQVLSDLQRRDCAEERIWLESQSSKAFIQDFATAASESAIQKAPSQT